MDQPQTTDQETLARKLAAILKDNTNPPQDILPELEQLKDAFRRIRTNEQIAGCTSFSEFVTQHVGCSYEALRKRISRMRAEPQEPPVTLVDGLEILDHLPGDLPTDDDPPEEADTDKDFLLLPPATHPLPTEDCAIGKCERDTVSEQLPAPGPSKNQLTEELLMILTSPMLECGNPDVGIDIMISRLALFDEVLRQNNMSRADLWQRIEEWRGYKRALPVTFHSKGEILHL